MKNKLIATLAAVSALSLCEFLEAYPYNVEVHGDADESGEKVSVSNLEENFTIGFNPYNSERPLLIDDEPVTVYDFVARIAKGDESVFEDWLLHAERFAPESSNDESEDHEIEDFGPDQ